MRNKLFKISALIKLFIAIFVLNLFNFCSSADMDTDISIRSLIQSDTRSDTVNNPNTFSYLFLGDTLTHYFKNYDEAEKGIVTLKSNDSKQNYIMSAICGQDGYIEFPTTTEKHLMAVVYEPTKKLYYYRNIILDINLPIIYLTVIMKPSAFTEDVNAIDIDSKYGWEGKMGNGTLIEE